MPAFPIIDEVMAQGDVARVFADFRRTKGTAFVPNFFKTLANAPAAMEGTWNVYRDVSNRGLLPTALKEMLFVAISAARNCQYCTTAHLAFCTLLGVDPATLVLLDTNISAIEPPRTRAVIHFAVRCATDPASLTAADYDALRAQGITDAELVEIGPTGGKVRRDAIGSVLHEQRFPFYCWHWHFGAKTARKTRFSPLRVGK